MVVAQLHTRDDGLASSHSSVCVPLTHPRPDQGGLVSFRSSGGPPPPPLHLTHRGIHTAWTERKKITQHSKETRTHTPEHGAED
jgi:hypothetical protein